MRTLHFSFAAGRWTLLAAVVLLLTGLLPVTAHAQPPAQMGDGWLATYWNNMTLSGAPILTRVDPEINFDWGLGSPAPEVNRDGFSARWTHTLEIPAAGDYRFTLNSDDGARLFIDGELVINAWYDHGPARTFAAVRTLSAGSHEVRVDYYERRGAAVARFDWQAVAAAPGNPPASTPPPPAATLPVNAGDWRGEFYNNRALLGAPALVRADAHIDFTWGAGSPAPGIIGADNFSTRWTTTLALPNSVYRFRITVDDGARVFVNDRLAIDAWREQGVTTVESADIPLGGAVPVRVEFFEATGDARITLTWYVVGAAPPPALPGGDAWTAEYFNNPDLASAPMLVRAEGGAIDYNWGDGSPAPGIVNSDNFSARWNRAIPFAPGAYRFRLTVDDGARLFVNNTLIINQWRQQAATEFTADITLPGGPIPVRLEYVDFAGNALIRLSWESIGGSGGSGGGGAAPAPIWNRVRPERPYTGEYFADRDLSGSPVFVRQDSEIDFDWGNGSPGPGMPADDFSVRWTNTLRLEQGKYRFMTDTDDGVRLFINDRLVIDKWQTQSRTRYTHETSLATGDYTIRMETFDAAGAAFARLRIEVLKDAGAPIGNIITCVPPQPQNYAWIKLYRLDDNHQWVSLGKGIGSISASGFLKIDGLPVDVNRFGAAGEPYKVEQWVDGRVVRSTGDFHRGESEFRVRAFADNVTPWICAP